MYIYMYIYTYMYVCIHVYKYIEPKTADCFAQCIQLYTACGNGCTRIARTHSFSCSIPNNVYVHIIIMYM